MILAKLIKSYEMQYAAPYEFEVWPDVLYPLPLVKTVNPVTGRAMEKWMRCERVVCCIEFILFTSVLLNLHFFSI